jgi:hypothetical protein
MKKLFIILFFISVTFPGLVAQDKTTGIEMFRSSVLPQFKTYFTDAGLTGNGQLELTAATGYSSLAKENKNTVMDMLVRSWQNTLIVVRNDSSRELWGINTKTGKAMLIETWSIDGNKIAEAARIPESKTAQHPWFVYFGLQSQFDSQHNINMGFSTRFGFFLLKNRWDLAASASGFIFGNIDNESQTFQSNVGISSKVYFPIKKLRISPNIGGEISYSTYSVEDTETSSVSPYALTGLSWYVGNGSFDVGVRTGRQTIVMVGYTFIPRLNSSR